MENRTIGDASWSEIARIEHCLARSQAKMESHARFSNQRTLGCSLVAIWQ